MSSTLRTAVPALLLASSAGVAPAQQPAAGKATAPSAAASAPRQAAPVAAPAASAAPAAGAALYRSAFEGYRPLKDQPLLPWRESNDIVARIGGWQSYAREGQASAPAGTAETPARAASQSKAAAAPAAASAAMPGGHSGHKQP